MQENCTDCLSREVCEITGGVCKKMGALFNRTILNGKTTMTNTPKATPKTVAEQGKASNDVTDAVINGESTQRVAEKVKKTIPSQTGESTTDDQEIKDAQSDEKLTLVQRLKSMTEKLKQNKKALLILGGAVVVTGLVVKNNRKPVDEKTTDETEGPITDIDSHEISDENPDSV